MNIHSRIAGRHDEESLDVVESICISTDLLEQLFSEVRSLAIDHPEFARALSSRGSDVRARLLTLHEIVALLKWGGDSTMVAQLTRRATALISWLSAKIDELTLSALSDGDSMDRSASALH